MYSRLYARFETGGKSRLEIEGLINQGSCQVSRIVNTQDRVSFQGVITDPANAAKFRLTELKTFFEAKPHQGTKEGENDAPVGDND